MAGNGNRIPLERSGIFANRALATQSRSGLATWARRQKRFLSEIALLLLSAAALIAAVVWIWQKELGAWAAFASLMLSIALVLRADTAKREASVYVLGAVVIISALDYMGWRIRLINLQGFWIGIPLFIAELFGALHVIGLQTTLWPRRAAPLENKVDPTRLPIYIFIPTVNEGVKVLRQTVLGALAARECYLNQHPRARVTIIICNDGFVAGNAEWREAEQFAHAMGVVCVTRTVGGGAKAGNIENARQVVGATGNALLAIFDADQVAAPDFLTATIPPFADPGIGWVQTGQYYGNLDNSVSAWAQDQQSLFYRLLCPGKSAMNAAFICGTNVVLRAAALDEIGGLPQNSVTEDFAASIQLHSRWRSIFIEGRFALGIGPMDLKSYFKQQHRWAIGTLSVLRSHWKELLLPRRGGLSISQRIQYLLACTHYLSGLRDCIYVIAPIIFLTTGIPAVRGSDLESFFWHFLPYFLASQVAFWAAAYGKTGLRGIIIGFASYPILLGSILTAFSGRRIGFQVTSKQRLNVSNLKQVRVHIIFLLLSAVALIFGTHLAFTASPASVIVSIVWIIYQMILLGAAIWLAVADDVRTLVPARFLERVSGAKWHGFVQRRAAVSTALVGAAVMVVGLAFASPTTHAPATIFDLSRSTHAPSFGVTLPYDLVSTRLPVLVQQIDTPITIVGRTQEITDGFDDQWAQQINQTGATPWVTLLFSQPGVEVFYAGLPAIINGVHDDGLHRWARRIADYGHPLYLTVLPHVDRNWVVSSAVANGGIPQDVPRAWAHIRAIFAEEGATNVAWVWAPADPTNDKLYVPPEQSIDLVLMSLIRYPDTAWPDPEIELSGLKRAHPDRPVFVEVSASGTPERKAAYFEQLGHALLRLPNLYAVLYHEGSPKPDATGADHAPWSMLSDPLSEAAMRHAVDQLIQTNHNAENATSDEVEHSGL